MAVNEMKLRGILCSNGKNALFDFFTKGKQFHTRLLVSQIGPSLAEALYQVAIQPYPQK
jgi:hypothetical protein